MKNSETGEYELVVGNPQLLSAFFIVVLLCGVAFGMGYVMGQSSQKPRPADAASNTSPQVPAPTTVVSNSPAQPAADQPASQPAASDSPAAQPEPAPPQPTTQPARDTATAPAQAPARPAPSAEAPEGSYWQVAAFKAAEEAQPIVHTLRDGGLSVYVRKLPVTKFPDGLFRVLVGPYPDKRALSNARQDLTDRFKIKLVIARTLPVE